MRVVRTEKDRWRYHCRSKAQGRGCSGKGSFLDRYNEQVLRDLATFTSPDEWRRIVLDEAARSAGADDDRREQRRQLEARLVRVRNLYSWGDLTRDEYRAERDRVERELARLVPTEAKQDQLGALAAYLERLPTAWADATPEQRNRFANLVYEEICVDGPVVEYVKPRPELEPLFQSRTGATQPTRCVTPTCWQ